jgi:hypothetical protein
MRRLTTFTVQTQPMGFNMLKLMLAVLRQCILAWERYNTLLSETRKPPQLDACTK